MLVYRLETAGEGRGAWNSGIVYTYLSYKEEGPSPYDHPGPLDSRENGTALYKHFSKARKKDRPITLFGTHQKNLIEMWFPCPKGRVAAAAKGDAVINVYEVPDERVILGRFQCVFDPNHAVRVGMLNIETLDFIEVDRRPRIG